MRRGLLVVALAALMAAGCGDPDDDVATTPPPAEVKPAPREAGPLDVTWRLAADGSSETTSRPARDPEVQRFTLVNRRERPATLRASSDSGQEQVTVPAGASRTVSWARTEPPPDRLVSSVRVAGDPESLQRSTIPVG